MKEIHGGERLFFSYGSQETDYLKAKDALLAEAIEKIGHIDRKVDTDLYSAVVHHIIAQQITTKAQQTIWQRMKDTFGEVTSKTISNANIKTLQSVGISFRKAEYIKDFSQKILNKEFDLDAVEKMSDEDAIKALSSLKGVGIWTAEMILLFCLQRPNVLSFSDLAILRGMRMLYHHREIDKKLFDEYRTRFSPYGSVASLYLWAIAGGAIPELKDYAPSKKV